MNLDKYVSDCIVYKSYEEIAILAEEQALRELFPEDIEEEEGPRDIEDIRADFLSKNKNIFSIRIKLNDKKKFKDLINKALQYIPSVEEKILHDLCFSAHPIRTIAKELGISKNSVLNRKQRAMIRMFYILGFLTRDLEIPTVLRRTRLDLTSLSVLGH